LKEDQGPGTKKAASKTKNEGNGNEKLTKWSRKANGADSHTQGLAFRRSACICTHIYDAPATPTEGAVTPWESADFIAQLIRKNLNFILTSQKFAIQFSDPNRRGNIVYKSIQKLKINIHF